MGEGRHTELRDDEDMLVLSIFEDDPDGSSRLVGFNLVSESSEEGSPAFDTGAMLTLRIEEDNR